MTVESPPAAPGASAVALAVWLAVVALAHVWGTRLMAQGVRIVLYTPPVLGGYRPAIPAGLVLPVVIGAGLVVGLPTVVERARWHGVLAAATGAAAAWWVSLALVDGVDGLTRGLLWDADYAVAAPRAGRDPAGFLQGYVDGLPAQSIALRGHPPGFALLFGVLDRIGLGGAGPAAVVVVAGGLAAVPAVLVTVRIVAGESFARRAAPFLVLAPYGLWVVTSTDGLSMGTAAWMVALIALAGATGGVRSDLSAAGAGVLAAATLLQSYGLVLMALPVAVVAVLTVDPSRRWRLGVIAAAPAAVVMLAVAAAGFWLPAGLAATIHEYRTLDLDRPYGFFLLANGAAWFLALGPATVVAITRLRHGRAWALVGAGMAAAALAEVSGLSEGEVERIWLPFTVWVLPAGAALWSTHRAVRAWLGLQAAAALAVTARVATLW